MNMVRIRTLMSLIVFSLVFSFGFMAVAQTPDGETPAEETCCDPLSGALFGLCNAYCEAMDCDSEVGYNQHPDACDKVFGNYLKKADAVGPPCVCEEICVDNFETCQEEAQCEEARNGCFRDCEGLTGPPRRQCRAVCRAEFDECNEPCVEEGTECREGCCEQIGQEFIPGEGCVDPPPTRCGEPFSCGDNSDDFLCNLGLCEEPPPPGFAGDPICFEDRTGRGICSFNYACAGLPPCNDAGRCRDGSVCMLDTCCGDSVCAPVGVLCPPPGQVNGFNLQLQLGGPSATGN